MEKLSCHNFEWWFLLELLFARWCAEKSAFSCDVFGLVLKGKGPLMMSWVLWLSHMNPLTLMRRLMSDCWWSNTTHHPPTTLFWCRRLINIYLRRDECHLISDICESRFSFHALGIFISISFSALMAFVPSHRNASLFPSSRRNAWKISRRPKTNFRSILSHIRCFVHSWTEKCCILGRSFVRPTKLKVEK